MLVLYKLFFTLVSLLLLAVIYLINGSIEIGRLTGLHLWFDMPAIVSYLIYIVGSLFLTWLCTLAFSMTKKHIYLGQEIDFANLKRLNDYSYVDIN